jgi:tetratricopeptide (TPR) repeat protein
MAVRLSASSSQSPTVATSELPLLAAQLLAADDLDGYRRLFARLGSIEDPHRRYWAGSSLIERGLDASVEVPTARLPALLQTLAASALGVLEREPSEPRLLGYAGLILYKLWSLDAAEAMFNAAKRLDPSLDQVDRYLDALAARRRARRGSASHAPLRGALPDLSRRALELAARAQPADGLRLSLCMIVRDEQELLPRCLRAVAEVVDEIVVVDTGSTDATIEIARSFGARVIEREWSGSFAEARNVSFDAARGDWLMYLDADEVLVREDAALLRSLSGRTWREAFYLSETSFTGELDGGTAVAHDALRVFRNRPEYRFEGRLHEQIAHRLPGYLSERIEVTDVRLEHYGYLGAVRDGRAKARRNIELLRLEQAEGPATPFLHYNLGCEHAAAGEAMHALGEFERAWELLQGVADRDSHRFEPALISRLAKTLRACGRAREALAVAGDGLERFPAFTDLVLEQALAASALGQDDDAIALYERCIEMGDAPRGYTARVGGGSYLPRLHLAECRLARGEFGQAIELLEQCLREHPHFIAARFMLGTALYEAGANAAGEEQFRAVLARQPRHARARVALAEALLAQRRYGEAAEAAEAAALASDDELAVIACRTELFARIAGANAQGTVSALARAHAVGMAAEEIELFSGWEQLTSTGETAVVPSSHALRRLAVMLEALLRVQHFEAFETLLGLLARAEISARDRRELLAAIYLRRGFAVSAAQEWMVVCREQPDARALLGLARVALATGMSGEANDFAAAALECDPDNQGATALLAKVRGEALLA